MSLNFFFKLVGLASAAALDYCSSLGPGGDQTCETLRHTSGSAVYLDTGELKTGVVAIETLRNMTGVKELRNMHPRPQPSRAMSAKIRNFRRYRLQTRLNTPTGLNLGDLPAYQGGRPGLKQPSSYVGQVFHFMRGEEQVAKITLTAGVNLYIIEPAADDAEALASEEYRRVKEEAEFMPKYQRETGAPWLAYYKREKPILNMWPAEFLGQTHVVASPHAYTHADGVSEGDLALSLQVLSHAPAGPRVFLVKELMSDFECDHIIQLGKKVIQESTVGDVGAHYKSNTRTSQNGWLRRTQSETLERVYKRFGDVLGIDHALLSEGVNAEPLQVVHYGPNQRYDPHLDFSDKGIPDQRLLTLLLYVDLPEAGGATSFPKAFDGRGLQVVPARGDAVLFYSMLPDGNADDLSLHAGMPILEGSKWVCNLWVWDPKRGR